MRQPIYQGESAQFVIRPRWELPRECTIEAAVVGPSRSVAAKFSTDADSEAEKITTAANGLMAFCLLPKQTARMCGKYRIEIRIICGDSVIIRSRWTICIHRSVLGRKQ